MALTNFQFPLQSINRCPFKQQRKSKQISNWTEFKDPEPGDDDDDDKKKEKKEKKDKTGGSGGGSGAAAAASSAAGGGGGGGTALAGKDNLAATKWN